MKKEKEFIFLKACTIFSNPICMSIYSYDGLGNGAVFIYHHN
jgi:hypothetical protein